MSLTWSAPQTSRLRAWLGRFLSDGDTSARTITARTGLDPRGAVFPGLALHSGLASTSHLEPQLGNGTGYWTSLAKLDDAPKKVLVVPGAALGRAQRDHIQDIGLWPQGASTLNNAIQILRRDPLGWHALIVDLDMIEHQPAHTMAVAALRRSRPDLHVILMSRRSGADGDVGDADIVLKRPFSLQQLEVALDRNDYE